MAGEIDLNKFVAYWESKGLKMKARRYRQIADEDRVPKVVKGKILDPMATMTALACYYQKLAEGNGSLSLTDERTRLTRINADRKQLELQQARGELIRTEVAQKLWAAVMANINSKIEIIPQKLPPLAFGLSIPEIKALTERMIYEVRMEIANPDLEEISKAGSDTKRVDKSGKTTKNKSIGRSKNGKKKFKSH